LKVIRCVVDVNKALDMGFTTLRDVGSTNSKSEALS
jgi:hypothetical protein